MPSRVSPMRPKLTSLFLQKPSKWALPNKGVKARASRDIELEEVGRPTLDASLAQLQRKSQIYEKLSKGKSGGLNEKQYEALLVDVSTNCS